MKSISVPLASGKIARVHLDPRGTAGGQSSSAMIYYDPSLNESEVAQALESQDFVDAWNAHQSKSTGTPYNAEGGFDVVDKFKSDQKEAFAEAAPIIHDLVMDVVRTTGGEIPYAMYVIREHGYVEYIGGELESKIDDINSTVQFAKEHPLQAGGLAVIAIAANGKRIGAKRFKNKKNRNATSKTPEVKQSTTSPASPADRGGTKSAIGQVEGKSLSAARIGDEDSLASARKYEVNTKHGLEPRIEKGVYIGKRPTNPEKVLESTVRISPNSSRRIGYDPVTDEIVIFDRDSDWWDTWDDGEKFQRGGIYHGHVCPWELLHKPIQRLLINLGLFNNKGKYIGPK